LTSQSLKERWGTTLNPIFFIWEVLGSEDSALRHHLRVTFRSFDVDNPFYVTIVDDEKFLLSERVFISLDTQ